MHYEVEKKAHLLDDQYQHIDSFLHDHAIYVGEQFCKDIYFKPKIITVQPTNTLSYPIFRVRIENKKAWLTYKKKVDHSHLNVNLEQEMVIHEYLPFRKWIQFLQYYPFIRKIKQSKVYTFQQLRVELNHISHLGYFLEVEKIISIDSPKIDSAAIEQVHLAMGNLFRTLKISEEQVEKRLYLELLMERGFERNP